MSLKDKNVLVCGMGISGVGACRLLSREGAVLSLSDLKERDKLSDSLCSELEEMGVTLILGMNPDDFVERFDLVVLSPGIPIDLPFLAKAREHHIPIWGEIELAYRYCKAPVIAITGTNGKSTTTMLTGRIMQDVRPGSAVVGNIGTSFCENAADLTEDDFAVAEISSFQLEGSVTFRPAISCVLNITPDHLNRHKTLENYIALKERVFVHQREQDYLVLNFDDLYCRSMWEKTRARVLFYSSKYELPEGIYMKDGYMHLKWNHRHEKLAAREELGTPFGHIVENMMAAAGIAVCAGVPLPVIRKNLLNFKALEHRVEPCGNLRGIEFINDSKATNTDSAIKALESIQKPVLLIGGGLDKKVSFDDWVKLFPGKVKFAALLGETAASIAECCKSHGFTDVEITNSLKSATELCYKHAEPGDCVLLSPASASLDMFESFEERGRLFKDFVRELIEQDSKQAGQDMESHYGKS